MQGRTHYLFHLQYLRRKIKQVLMILLIYLRLTFFMLQQWLTDRMEKQNRQ